VQVHNRTAAVVASQALALSQLAPGRFRLGLGFDRGLQRPLAYMREFLLAIRPSLDAAGVPLVLATIGPRSFELAGELAEEAMTWLVEPHVVRDIAGPRLESAAAGAGRPVPPVILHMNVTFDPDFEQAAMTIRSSPLGRMRADGWPDSAVENLTAWGPDDQVRQQLQHALDISGAAELMLRPVFHDPQNPGDEGERFLRLVARLND
jgi:alkanesulfonate monooxygenase SsuD/methylene tetrahydromethanopterin reductase-like flavin-dependent oxidoreductase (luciferase family)